MKRVFIFLMLFSHQALAGVCVTGWEEVSSNNLSYLENELAIENPYMMYVRSGNYRCEDIKKLSHDLEVYAIALGAGSALLCTNPVTLKAGILVGLTSSSLVWLKAELDNMPCEDGSERRQKERIRYEVCLELEKQGVRCNPQGVEIKEAVAIPGLEV